MKNLIKVICAVLICFGISACGEASSSSTSSSSYSTSLNTLPSHVITSAQPSTSSSVSSTPEVLTDFEKLAKFFTENNGVYEFEEGNYSFKFEYFEKAKSFKYSIIYVENSGLVYTTSFESDRNKDSIGLYVNGKLVISQIPSYTDIKFDIKLDFTKDFSKSEVIGKVSNDYNDEKFMDLAPTKNNILPVCTLELLSEIQSFMMDEFEISLKDYCLLGN